MMLFPAIDLKDGACVRLLRGEMEQATVYAEDPAAQAAAFAAQGFLRLHVVDLNGAFDGLPVNAKAVEKILSATPHPVQLGGGMRSLADIERWLQAGIARVILGTLAIKQPELVREACRLFPGRVAVGIDAKQGRVAIEGWANVTQTRVVDLAKSFEDAGVSAIIYTDIARDGALEGPNLEETVTLAEALSTPVILSGGMSSLEDVKRVKREAGHLLEGIILGRALYDGRIEPSEALKVVG